MLWLCLPAWWQHHANPSMCTYWYLKRADKEHSIPQLDHMVQQILWPWMSRASAGSDEIFTGSCLRIHPSIHPSGHANLSLLLLVTAEEADLSTSTTHVIIKALPLHEIREWMQHRHGPRVLLRHNVHTPSIAERHNSERFTPGDYMSPAQHIALPCLILSRELIWWDIQTRGILMKIIAILSRELTWWDIQTKGILMKIYSKSTAAGFVKYIFRRPTQSLKTYPISFGLLTCLIFFPMVLLSFLFLIWCYFPINNVGK